MLRIEFSTGNAAFKPDFETESKWENEYYRNEEVKRVLKNICNQLDNGNTYGPCMDMNGNRIGEWELTD